MSMNNNQPQSPREYPANNYVPVRVFRRNRAPLTTDYRNFVVRDFWNDISSNDLWYLTDKAAGVATWIKLGGSSTGDIQFEAGDSGGNVPPDASGVIYNLGGTGITTTGNPATNTLTFDLDGDIAQSYPCDSGTAVPAANVLNVFGGTGATTSGAGNTITVDVVGGGLKWIEILVTGPTGLNINTGYVTNNAGVVGMTLPAAAPFGTVIRICGKGAGGWSLGQNAGQTIHMGNVDSTTGAGGSIASTQRYDCLELLCTTANTDFTVLSSVGVLNII